MTDVRLSRQLAEQGYSYAEMARMTRNAELVRIRRGAYAPPPGSTLDPRIAHRLLLEATLGQSSAESVVSHQSAAVLYGLPIGNDQLDRVHLTRNRVGQGKVRRYVHVHGLPLDDEDVVQVDEFPVTSLARTVLDIACSFRPLQAVPVGDAALRAGLRTEELTTQTGPVSIAAWNRSSAAHSLLAGRPQRECRGVDEQSGLRRPSNPDARAAVRGLRSSRQARGAV
jgi:hypothetical protein